MDVRPYILTVILGGAALTVLYRTAPMVLIRRFNLPPWLNGSLAFVPTAVMAALLAQRLLLPGGELMAWPPQQPDLFLIVPVFAMAALTRSLLGAVLTGIVGMGLWIWWAAGA